MCNILNILSIRCNTCFSNDCLFNFLVVVVAPPPAEGAQRAGPHQEGCGHGQPEEPGGSVGPPAAGRRPRPALRAAGHCAEDGPRPHALLRLPGEVSSETSGMDFGLPVD